MSRFLPLSLFLCVLTAMAFGEQKSPKRQFVGATFMQGTVFPTNDFVRGANKIPAYSSASVRYGVMPKFDSPLDYAYGLPYWGASIYTATFHRPNDLGNPVAIDVFQGARLHQFTQRLGINYEWMLGCAFNFKPYDPFTNPNNVAIGSTVNVHIAGSLYLKWSFSKKVDLNVGATVTHFSNGSSTQPNNGINAVAGVVGLTYVFNREKFLPQNYIGEQMHNFVKRRDMDLTFTFTTRRIEVDTIGTGVSSPYPAQKFKVVGLSYAYMFVPTQRLKWGFSTEFFYDESAGVTTFAERLPGTDKLYDRIMLGKISDRFSIGASLKGELGMPLYSIFMQMGYDIKHANTGESRFYQILGVKIPLNPSLSVIFGIRATELSRAQYLYWSAGYRLWSHPKKHKNIPKELQER